MAACKLCNAEISADAAVCPYCGGKTGQTARPVGRLKVQPATPGGWDGIAQPERHDPAADDFRTAAGLGMLVLGAVQILYWLLFCGLLGIAAWQLFGTIFCIENDGSVKISLLKILLDQPALPAPVQMTAIVWYGYIGTGVLLLITLGLILVGSIHFFGFRLATWRSLWLRLEFAYIILLLARIGSAVVYFVMADRELLRFPAGNYVSIALLFIGVIVCQAVMRAHSEC